MIGIPGNGRQLADILRAWKASSYLSRKSYLGRRVLNDCIRRSGWLWRTRFLAEPMKRLPQAQGNAELQKNTSPTPLQQLWLDLRTPLPHEILRGIQLSKTWDCPSTTTSQLAIFAIEFRSSNCTGRLSSSPTPGDYLSKYLRYKHKRRLLTMRERRGVAFARPRPPALDRRQAYGFLVSVHVYSLLNALLSHVSI